jgi:hypothetical protein
MAVRATKSEYQLLLVVVFVVAVVEVDAYGLCFSAVVVETAACFLFRVSEKCAVDANTGISIGPAERSLPDGCTSVCLVGCCVVAGCAQFCIQKRGCRARIGRYIRHEPTRMRRRAPHGHSTTSKLVLYTERIRMLLWLCFLRGVVSMFFPCVYGYVFSVGLFLCFFRASMAMLFRGAIAMLYSSVYFCEQRPAPAIHLGPFLCFIRLLLLASSGPRPLYIWGVCNIFFTKILAESFSRRDVSKDERKHEITKNHEKRRSDGPFRWTVRRLQTTNCKSNTRGVITTLFRTVFYMADC